jgi:hypothetical protein
MYVRVFSAILWGTILDCRQKRPVSVSDGPKGAANGTKFPHGDPMRGKPSGLRGEIVQILEQTCEN